jgi:hypothetical protein
MTAIYAYAQDDMALVGGDTSRTYRGGVSLQACKLYHWSDCVLLAQAGESQFLTQLLGTLLPQAGFSGLTDTGFFATFAQLHAKFWNDAENYYLARNLGAVPDGTVLVAAAATSTAPARIHRVDFRTGIPTPCHASPVADGADAIQFTSDAQGHLAALRAASGGAGVPLDTWVALCVTDAANGYPGLVAYPADVLVARPSLVGDRIVVQRRLHSPTPLPIALFEAP